MVLCGVTHTDNEIDIDYIVPKILKLKLWESKDKAWNANVVEQGFQILFVSQFTLYHQLKGTKPDFHGAADHEVAKTMYNQALAQLQMEYLAARKAAKVEGPDLVEWVQPGSFGQYMQIS